MAWVTWRQHRVALAGVAALLGALTLWLLITGLQLHHAYGAVRACRPASSYTCGSTLGDFENSYDATGNLIAGFLQAVPALVGAFVGAPLLARELETGTFRYAFTLGFERWRWALAKLVALAFVVTAASGMFSVLFSWYYQPFFAEGTASPVAPLVFDLRGVTFAAWTLVAFAIGALAGMLIRRVVPAIVATLAIYAGTALGAAGLLRPHYLPAVVTRTLTSPPPSAWLLAKWWTKDGKFAFSGYPPQIVQHRDCPPSLFGAGGPSLGQVMHCFAQHGYAQWVSYQPASRFWPFQWVEGGWLVGLAVLLVAATVWLVRRRLG
jgi:hypothetical protein